MPHSRFIAIHPALGRAACLWGLVAGALTGCGDGSTRTVTLQTGMENAGPATDLSKLFTPMALVPGPGVPTCKQKDMRVGFRPEGGPLTILPVEMESADLSGANSLSAVVQGIRFAPIQITLPRYVPTQVTFFGSIVKAIDREDCPRTQLVSGTYLASDSFSFQGIQRVTIDQQESIPMTVWGGPIGTPPSSTACRGSDCAPQHFIKVEPYADLLIEYFPENGMPAAQIVDSNFTSPPSPSYIPKVSSYRISTITWGSPGSPPTYTLCGSLLKLSEIPAPTPSPGSLEFSCGGSGTSLTAKFFKL